MTQPLRLIQYRDHDDATRAGVLADDGVDVRPIEGVATVYELAVEAAAGGRTLAEVVAPRLASETFAFDLLERANRLLPPISHPDAAHCLLTGTGLTHRASAAGRDAMHAALTAGRETDSLRVYRTGEEGGRPTAGDIGALPEWFYKGDGSGLVAPGADLPLPAYAEDGGDEAEIAGIYVIAPDGTPIRLGFALANEFSDHGLERQNYLYLAHSKLRCAAIGPEILVGEMPDDVQGHARIIRDGISAWESPFATGDANMCHSIANLEHHHFKYPQFRRPGDVHVHFLGAATGSFTDDFETRDGDIFEIEAAPFVQPLRNRLVQQPGERLVEVGSL